MLELKAKPNVVDSHVNIRKAMLAADQMLHDLVNDQSDILVHVIDHVVSTEDAIRILKNVIDVRSRRGVDVSAYIKWLMNKEDKLRAIRAAAEATGD